MLMFDFDRLRRLRKQRYMTQQEAGALLGYSAATIGRYERGDVEIPVAELVRIANVYGDKNVQNFFVERIG